MCVYVHMCEKRAENFDNARIFNEELWVVWRKRTENPWANTQEKKNVVDMCWKTW